MLFKIPRAGRLRVGRTSKPERQCPRIECQGTCTYSANEFTTVYLIKRLALNCHLGSPAKAKRSYFTGTAIGGSGMSPNENISPCQSARPLPLLK